MRTVFKKGCKAGRLKSIKIIVEFVANQELIILVRYVILIFEKWWTYPETIGPKIQIKQFKVELNCCYCMLVNHVYFKIALDSLLPINLIGGIYF